MRILTPRLPLLLAIALLPLAYAQAAPTPATILVGGRIVPFQVKPFVGPDGQVLAPVDAVQLLGAKFAPNSDGTVTVTAANGRRAAFPYTAVDGRYCVPFQKVALMLGGSTDWQPTTQTLTIRARLEMVRQDDGALTIYTSYPVYYSVKRIANPERLYVDLFGLDLATTPANIPSRSGEVSRIRSGQIDRQTVRITVDLKQGVAFRVLSGVQASEVQVAISDLGHPTLPSSVAPPPVPARPMPPVVQPPTPHLPTAVAAVAITAVACKTVSPALTQISVSTTGPVKYRTEMLDNPSRLAFDLAGATPDRGLRLAQSVDSPVVKAIRVGAVPLFGRVVLDLSRLVGFTIESHPTEGGMTYLIDVQTPTVPPSSGTVQPMPVSASLAGKIICIDPGHGSQDSGAVGIGGVREKDLVLQIGLRLRTALTQNGATVFMTRDGDSFLPVDARPRFAADHNADYYISVHCDSSGADNSHSGTTVYYHAQNLVCRLLAADISRRVAEVSGIPRAGTKSDTIRFVTGFGVLRGSSVPAVLVECGYVNSAADLAKLRDDGTQQHIAEGIVAGLRDFIADQGGAARAAGAASQEGN